MPMSRAHLRSLPIRREPRTDRLGFTLERHRPPSAWSAYCAAKVVLLHGFRHPNPNRKRNSNPNPIPWLRTP